MQHEMINLIIRSRAKLENLQSAAELRQEILTKEQPMNRFDMAEKDFYEALKVSSSNDCKKNIPYLVSNDSKAQRCDLTSVK